VEPLEDRSLPSVQVLATLRDTAPGPGAAGFLINDFEPNGLNNKGEALFGADLGTTADASSFIGEGIYLRNNQGQATRLAGSTDAAPGGATYDFGFFGPSTLNDQGDAAFAFILSPFTLPFGVNGGLLRYSHNTNAVTPVVQPFVTPAPIGGAFQGAMFGYTLNNNGDLLFDGIINTANGVHAPGEDYTGLGEGIFGADKAGHISRLVVPGDAAPGGGTFDMVSFPWGNAGGDMAFVGHVAGEPLFPPDSPLYNPQSNEINSPGSVYFRDGATGKVISIAHIGQAAPGGGTFYVAYDPELNNSGDIIFTGTLVPTLDQSGLFRYSKGALSAIVRPGDAMPGGGHLVSISQITGNQKHINNQGDVVFTATLDTNTRGVPDTGLYLWSKGTLSLIARSGTVLPGVGTVASITSPANVIIGPSPGFFATGGSINNDRGQVLYSATLTDGHGVLLLYTPGGDPVLAAASPRAPTSQALTPAQLQPVLQAAIADWRAAGASPAQVALLSQVPVQIAALPAGHLGEEAAGQIWVSPNAGGWGWYTGAAPGSPGRMDLLSVLGHELGHVLGLKDSLDTRDVMGESLAPGVRRLPAATDVLATGVRPSVAPPAGSGEQDSAALLVSIATAHTSIVPALPDAVPTAALPSAGRGQSAPALPAARIQDSGTTPPPAPPARAAAILDQVFATIAVKPLRERSWSDPFGLSGA
jgi:hypothetical protein